MWAESSQAVRQPARLWNALGLLAPYSLETSKCQQAQPPGGRENHVVSSSRRGALEHGHGSHDLKGHERPVEAALPGELPGDRECGPHAWLIERCSAGEGAPRAALPGQGWGCPSTGGS